MANNANNSVNASFNGWAETKASYRFFSNVKVSPTKILSPHQQQTTRRAAEFDTILHVQDTTQFDYSGRSNNISGMGKLRQEHEQSFFMHPTVAFTTAGLCLGVVKNKVLVGRICPTPL